MPIIQLITLAFVQGLTEFLPISSSAHLILIPHLSGWPDQGLVFDIAAHFGSLAAVLAYFRADFLAMSQAWLESLRYRRLSEQGRLAWAVLFATIPVGLVGLFAHEYIQQNLRSPKIIVAATIGFGVALWVVDRFGKRERSISGLHRRDIVIIGLAQACALVPGTSRSGVTITAALALGLTREAAARFSFYLAAPVIFLASGYHLFTLFKQPQAVQWFDLGVMVSLSALTAYACISIFMNVVERIGLWPFALYRFALGGMLIWLFW